MKVLQQIFDKDYIVGYEIVDIEQSDGVNVYVPSELKGMNVLPNYIEMQMDKGVDDVDLRWEEKPGNITALKVDVIKKMLEELESKFKQCIEQSKTKQVKCVQLFETIQQFESLYREVQTRGWVVSDFIQQLKNICTNQGYRSVGKGIYVVKKEKNDTKFKGSTVICKITYQILHELNNGCKHEWIETKNMHIKGVQQVALQFIKMIHPTYEQLETYLKGCCEPNSFLVDPEFLLQAKDLYNQ